MEQHIRFKSIFLLLVGLICSSCSQLPEPNIEHRMPVNSLGDFDVSFEETHSLDPYSAQERHIRRVVDAASCSGKDKVLVSIHGGLGTKNEWTEKIAERVKLMEDDGYYPIFVTWRSGIFTSLKDRYKGVRNGVDRPRGQALLTSPFYLTSDLARGVASIPESVSEQTANFYTTHVRGYEEIEGELCRFSGPNSGYQENVFYSGYGQDLGFTESFGYRVKQFVPGVLRGVSTPILEGLGEDVWKIMLRRARFLTFRQLDLHQRGIQGRWDYYEGQTEKLPPAEVGSEYYSPNGPNGAAAQLIRGLSRTGKKITLVGHSMGAIVANDLVQAFPKTKFEKIIHMASADSSRSLLDKTFPYLKKNKSTEFWNLCLHPSNEWREQNALNTVPEGSLLIWLDYSLVEPETTLDRRAGRWDNIKWIAPQFTKLQNAKIKVFGRRELVPASDELMRWPIKHGDFGARAFWRPEFYSDKGISERESNCSWEEL